MTTHTTTRPRRPGLRASRRRGAPERILIGTVLFQGVTGTAGGLALATASGQEEYLPTEYLERIPFDSWFWPGVILGGGLGVTALVIGLGLLREPDWHWTAPLEHLTGHHWSWVAAIGLGLGLVAWILTQLLLLPDVSWLQPLYLAVGTTVVATAATPSVRARLRRPRSEP